MSQADPIQVFENHSGPIPPHSTVVGTTYSRYHFAYVAYRNAERDAHIYGYGHTKADAIADFIRNEAEAQCAACNGCEDSQDCILTSGQLAAYIRTQQVIYMNIESESHDDWKALNTDPNSDPNSKSYLVFHDASVTEVEAESFTEAAITASDRIPLHSRITRITRLRDNKTVEAL